MTKIIAEWVEIGIETEDYQEPFLLNIQTEMFRILLAELHAEQPYWRPISILHWYWWGLNTATDKYQDVVQGTGCKSCSDRSILAVQAMHEGTGECKHTSICTVWMSILWEDYEIDSRSYKIYHYWWLWSESWCYNPFTDVTPASTLQTAYE